MKHLTSHSKTSLFLMEMIVSLLILSLSACICVQIFAAAKSSREQAREWNHIQELSITAGEFLEGSSGTAEEFLSLYPNGIQNGQTLYYYYDPYWKSADESTGKYCMKMEYSNSISSGNKTVLLTFFKWDETLYEQKIQFPVFSSREEVFSS